MLPMQCYTLSCHSTSKKINIHKTKLKKSYGQTNIDKYKVAANITECHIISKLIFLRIVIPKFIMIRQLLHVKMSKSTC